MNEDIVKNAVLYILERAENQEIPIGKTRLIKILYLLDIENYKLNQIALTGLDWIFYKYGPYSFEIDDFLDKIGVAEEDIHIGGGKIFAKLKKEFGEDDIVGWRWPLSTVKPASPTIDSIDKKSPFSLSLIF